MSGSLASQLASGGTMRADVVNKGVAKDTGKVKPGIISRESVGLIRKTLQPPERKQKENLTRTIQGDISEAARLDGK